MSGAGREKAVSAGGFTKVVEATVTRPGTTTQYTAGDQVSDSESAPTVITFSDVARVLGGTGYVTGALCIDSAAQATKANLRLYLFDTSVTPNNDNAAWAPSDANLNDCLGFVEFSTWEVGTVTAGADGNCFSVGTMYPDRIGFVCGSTVRDIYGLLVERSTYTPVASEVFTIRLHVMQD